jgi:serine/threonine-protein kinase
VVQPLIDGYSLSDYNPEEQGLLDVDSVLDVIQAAALGMAIAHNKDFVHHNLSPENIRIDARGNVRVTDFYLSRMIYSVDQKLNKKADTIKCDPAVSPYFISPEKAESGVEDKRGDVFSFGVTMYYMLTGQYPFAGTNAVETVYSRVKKKHKKEEEVFNEAATRFITPETVDYVPPKHPSVIRPEIPAETDALIMDMLSYLPVKRPKFTEILAIFNLLRAEKNKKETVVAAQQKMVTTTTRAIPKMGNLSKKKKF